MNAAKSVSAVLYAEPPASAASSTATSTASAEQRIAAMFDHHYDAIWRTVKRLGVLDGDADDAAQKVFVIAARRIDTIIVGQEGRYLYGIAVRVASEMRRRAPSRRIAGGDELLAAIPDDARGPEEALLESEARDALDATLDGMSDDLRTVLVLVEIEGMAIVDLAEILEVPVGTATSRLRRAREEFSASARRVRARLGIHGGSK